MDQRTGCEHLPVNYCEKTQKITPDIQNCFKKRTSDYQRCCKNVATDTTIMNKKQGNSEYLLILTVIIFPITRGEGIQQIKKYQPENRRNTL